MAKKKKKINRDNNKTKSQCFENINKIDKSITRLTKKKKEDYNQK